MRELHDQISLLIAWMAQKERCPTWAGIHVLDTTRPDVRWIPEIGGWQVTRDALASPSAYEPQFRRLMNAGYGWINLSLYGVHEDSLVVGVELPSEPKKVPPGETTINFSGPPIRNGEVDWTLRLVPPPADPAR